MREAFAFFQVQKLLIFSNKKYGQISGINICNFNETLTNDVVSSEQLDRGPSCSKLMTMLVNVLLKFQTLISNICQNFLLKKCEKLLQCISFFHFFNQKKSVYLVIKL